MAKPQYLPGCLSDAIQWLQKWSTFHCESFSYKLTKFEVDRINLLGVLQVWPLWMKELHWAYLLLLVGDAITITPNFHADVLRPGLNLHWGVSTTSCSFFSFLFFFQLSIFLTEKQVHRFTVHQHHCRAALSHSQLPCNSFLQWCTGSKKLETPPSY